jgi:hypothetical protein
MGILKNGIMLVRPVFANAPAGKLVICERSETNCQSRTIPPVPMKIGDSKAYRRNNGIMTKV